MIHRLLISALAALPLISAEPDAVPPALPATVAATTGTGAPISLDEAIRLALQRNETVAIARARMDQAEANRRAALAALLPQVNAFGTYGNTSLTTGGPWSAEPTEAVTGELRLELLLFDAAAYPRVRAASRYAQAVGQDASELRRSLAYEVVAAYLDILLYERGREAALRRRQVSEKTLSDTKARVEAGLATRNDTLRVALENSTAELNVIQSSQLLTAARLTLSDLVAGPEGERPIAVPAPALLPSREPVALVELARRTRADLKATDLRRQAATEERRSALHSGYFPKLGARASYFDQELVGPAAYEQDPSWQAALVASWSLYDGGARYALADISAAQAREYAATLGAQGRGLVRDLGTAVAGLGAAEAGLAQARSGMEFALSNRDAVTAKAQQGLATPLEQADANASVFDAERSLVLAQNTVLLAHFRIRSLVGWWPLGERQPE